MSGLRSGTLSLWTQMFPWASLRTGAQKRLPGSDLADTAARWCNPARGWPPDAVVGLTRGVRRTRRRLRRRGAARRPPALTTPPLLRAEVPISQAATIGLTSDTASITSMEIVDNLVIFGGLVRWRLAWTLSFSGSPLRCHLGLPLSSPCQSIASSCAAARSTRLSIGFTRLGGEAPARLAG